MDVPPMEFSLDTDIWESNPNRAASRQISTEIQAALSTLIDELLEKEVIRPSKATAWSQVHLIWIPSGGWRFTIDYRALNKVITIDGWQIPNMKEMLQRIEAQRIWRCGPHSGIIPDAAIQGLLGLHIF